MNVPRETSLHLPTVTVRYSCHGCGIVRREVVVPARMSDADDVVKWMETLAGVISVDHSRASPLCTATTMSEVMIPISGTDRVGGVVKN